MAYDSTLAPPKTEGRPCLPPFPQTPSSSPMPPRGPFRKARGWSCQSHFPSNEVRGNSQGPARPRTERLSWGPWPKLPSGEVNKHKKKELLCPGSQSNSSEALREKGEDQKAGLGCPPPACPGGLCCWGWGGRAGLNHPLHQLWRRRLSQIQQIWACPRGQAPSIGRGWKCVPLTTSGPGAWQEMGWEWGADFQRPRESRKLQGFARGWRTVPEGGALRFSSSGARLLL